MKTRLIAALLVASALIGACTSGDDDDDVAVSDETTTEAPTETSTTSASPADGSTTTVAADDGGSTTTLPPLDGPAPGVTDDTIKIGITYVDLASMPALGIDHGDYEAAYTAVVDDINASGGIHGRLIEATIYPVSLTDQAAPEAVCVEMTEDEDVFAVVGFFLFDNVLCPVEVHSTMTIGGEMTAERLSRAQAPWYSIEGSSDRTADMVRSFAESGELDGTVGVVVGVDDQALLDDLALPILEEAGIEVVEQAVIDAEDTTDTAQVNAAVQVIIERFRSSGVDQVITVGQGAANAWPNGAEPTDYRPRLFVTDRDPALAYINAEGRDLSVFEGSVTGGTFGPRDEIYNLDNFQPCIDLMEAAGVEVPETEPDTTAGEADQFVSSQTACASMTLFRAIVEAAGPQLNYATVERAVADGIEMQLPTEPEPVTYGPAPSADGDRRIYLYRFDPESLTFSDRVDG